MITTHTVRKTDVAPTTFPALFYSAALLEIILVRTGSAGIIISSSNESRLGLVIGAGGADFNSSLTWRRITEPTTITFTP